MGEEQDENRLRLSMVMRRINSPPMPKSLKDKNLKLLTTWAIQDAAVQGGVREC